MRSVQVSKPNGPFEIVERDVPEPGAGKVRIKVVSMHQTICALSEKRLIL